MWTALMYVLVGLVAGTLGGMFGIGGGIVIIPALVYLFGFTQHEAQGTSMAFLVLPVGLLGAWKYFQNNNINFFAVGFIAFGFFVASLYGATLASKIPDIDLKRYFGIFLLLVSIKMIIGK